MLNLGQKQLLHYIMKKKYLINNVKSHLKNLIITIVHVGAHISVIFVQLMI